MYQTIPPTPPWQSHLILLSPEIAEEEDIFHLVGELKHGASRLLKVVIASMWLGSSIAQTGTEAQAAKLVPEKGAVILECTYNPSELKSYSQQNATECRYSLNFQKTRKSIQLVIYTSELVDSAMSSCALREPTLSGTLEGGVPKPRSSW
ncbi:unnamed protein product [Nyctereutes procyonoides]|uniref:(raccoon dog) hypothetical protein n=1 Tax=Nyctereutes procyonoides TaxID=34880 RepID=A0A811XPX0_NYCPR|nr:unnamed protein product [Nyctereutes procyonoides]